MKSQTHSKGPFFITTDKSQLDTEVIHTFLTTDSYWWPNDTPKKLIIEAIQNSILCYGVYVNDENVGDHKLIGFARVISDLVRFSWLCDVFILPEFRGKGLSKWLVSVIVEHPKLSGTRFNLGTNDAHGLYEQFGFTPLQEPEKRMERAIDWEKIFRRSVN
ncbi:GNAT family N-acetyltransferase [Alkalicoccobacillus gibsonii]|uniref:GNAT family N-acetyltransferase n=1 Tax=Alkalicoccobacillus gibsonii TaxID=79881 RepID=UPI003F7BADA5